MINSNNILIVCLIIGLTFLSGCSNENKKYLIEYMNNTVKNSKNETVKDIAKECRDRTIKLIEEISNISNDQIILSVNSFDFCFLNNRILILEKK